jgi:hypothetical protein
MTLHPASTSRAARRRLRTSGVTGVDATAVLTIADAAFLVDMQIGDDLSFTALTGGSALAIGTQYFIVSFVSPTVVKISDTYLGAPIAFGSDISAGTISSGTQVAESNHVPMGSPAGAPVSAGGVMGIGAGLSAPSQN